MLLIEEMGKIFRCSDNFKVSNKRQTRELEENHYSPLEKMRPYHAATVVWEMKRNLCKGEMCVFLCMSGQTTIQILFSFSYKHKLYALKKWDAATEGKNTDRS